VNLPKNPNAKAIRSGVLAAHARTVEVMRLQNVERGLLGKVTAVKLKMRRNPELQSGVLNVFPNLLHGGRKDGLGLPHLSPRYLGPVAHQQSGIPDALTIEAAHQGSKVTKWFYDEEKKTIRPEFYAMQKALFKDSFPFRHQLDFLERNPQYLPAGVTLDDLHADRAKVKAAGGNVNAPLFSVWRDAHGREHRLTYVESRQLYCAYMEELVQLQPEWRHLQQLVANGTNICIVGYDSQPLDRDANTRYLDSGRPFGHEDVLATLLTEPSERWPWHIHRTLSLPVSIVPISTPPSSSTSSSSTKPHKR
jgi:hypothetical protein